MKKKEVLLMHSLHAHNLERVRKRVRKRKNRNKFKEEISFQTYTVKQIILVPYFCCKKNICLCLFSLQNTTFLNS